MEKKCCNHDCNQGRTCPNRSKIIDAVNQTKKDMTLKDNNDGTFSIVAPCSFENQTKKEALELANDIDNCPYFDKGTGNVIRRLVEELDKQEYRNKHEGFSGIIEKIGDCQIHDLVHRTTPQTKPLSDNEIDKLIQNYKIGEFSGFYIDKVMTESMYERYNKVFAFVRAIEERHGIK